MVKQAIELKQRTGIDGLNLSPLQLEMQMRVLRERDRRSRIELAESVAVAVSGDKKVWESFVKCP